MSIPTHEIMKKFEEWLASPEGQQEWDEAFTEVAKASKELKEARRLSSKTLHEPFNFRGCTQTQ